MDLSLLDREIADLREKGRYRSLRRLSTPQDARIVMEGKEVLNFSSNNYLGLANHPALVEAAIEALRSHGFGMASVRFICGTQDLHKQLEAAIAGFLRTGDAILYTSCFDANTGLFETLLDDQDAVISDALNHASIIDGIRLCKAARYRYAHSDMQDLERQLQAAQSCRTRLIATDGVFSMDGDIAPLDQIVKMCKPHGAMIYVDDAHGEAVLGKGGRGIVSHFNLTHNDVHVEMGTFSKAFGVVGGHVSGSEYLRKYAYNKSRTWLLSGSPPPPVAAACIAAIDILETEPRHVENLWKNLWKNMVLCFVFLT